MSYDNQKADTIKWIKILNTYPYVRFLINYKSTNSSLLLYISYVSYNKVTLCAYLFALAYFYFLFIIIIIKGERAETMYIYEFLMDEKYEDLNPIQFGEQMCEPLHNFGPAMHPAWLLHYVISGHGTFIIDGNTFSLGAGDIFVIPPYHEVHYFADELDPWHYMWIGYEINNPSFEINQPILRYPELGIIFNSMRHGRDMSEGKTPFLCSKIWEIYSVLKEKTSTPDTNYIKNAINWMQSNYMQDIHIQDIADTLHLARSYFTSRFKAETGMSPHQYITMLRMEHALELMIRYNASPKTAALSTGYSDIYSFSKVFKQYYGLSPRFYIKKIKQA